jgi:hypothetical protein
MTGTQNNIMTKSENRGGRREGAGRPRLDDPRKNRGIKFNDDEWSIILRHATSKGMSVREYIWELVEKSLCECFSLLIK